MATRKKRRAKKKPAEEFTDLAIRVERYQAESDASINLSIYHPDNPFDIDEGDDPVFRFVTYLTVRGMVISPEDRAGDVYELTIHGDDAPSRYRNAKLNDFQAVDEHGRRQYRMYRGKRLPVYKPPHGIGMLRKVRGERRWTAWVTVLPRFVTDWLVLLRSEGQLYVGLQECKEGRDRWVRGLALRTTDPSEE